MKLERFLFRLLRSRLMSGEIASLSVEEREVWIDRFWQRVGHSLEVDQRYRLLGRVHELRRMHQFALLGSVDQARIIGLFRLLEEIGDLPGDVVECGVGRGVSLSALTYGVSLFGVHRKV